MSSDARFEDAAEKPLRLRAFDAEDLGVISSLVQDAVLPMDQLHWDRKRRRLAVLINRFRWERGAAMAPERVQSVLAIEDVAKVSSQGADLGAKSNVSSVLSISFETGQDGSGNVVLILAGGGALRADVEALEVTLRDVTRPYSAPSGARPSHDA